MSSGVETEELSRRLARELGDRVRVGGFVYPLILIIIGTQTSVTHDYPYLYWLFSVLMAGVLAYRTKLAIRLKHAGVDWRERLEQLRVVSVLMLLFWSGMITAGLVRYSHSEFAQSMLMGIVVWATIGATVFAPDLKMAMVFIHLMLLPPFAWTVAMYEKYGWFLWGFVLSWVFVVLATRRSHFHLRRMLSTQLALEQQALELRHARDLAEEASRAKSQFLANVSHEIRTPLNGILGVADLLREADLKEDERELLEILSSSGKHLLTLVNDLLDITRINAGKLHLEKTGYEVRKLVEEASAPLRVAAEEKGLRWEVKVRREVPEKCIGDPVRLRQILSNLMSNAMKFTHAGGVCVDVGMADGKNLRFVVEDTGIGIAGDKLDGIFEEFEQADRSTTRRYGGTGLGLAISKKLVELMGGRIGVKSEPGRGSMFWFEVGTDPPI